MFLLRIRSSRQSGTDPRKVRRGSTSPHETNTVEVRKCDLRRKKKRIVGDEEVATLVLASKAWKTCFSQYATRTIIGGAIRARRHFCLSRRQTERGNTPRACLEYTEYILTPYARRGSTRLDRRFTSGALVRFRLGNRALSLSSSVHTSFQCQYASERSYELNS